MKNAVQLVSEKLNLRPTVNRCGGGWVYEWQIPETTVERLSSELKEFFKKMGMTTFNVDSSREPYYLVCARLTSCVEL